MKRILPLALATLFCLHAAPLPAAEPETEAQGERAVSLGEVIVQPFRTVMDEALSEETVRAAEARRMPLIDNDLLRAIHHHPGVAGDDFSARFGVRGGERDETVVVLDGMDLYEPYHLQDFGGAISIVDLLAVSRARLYLGGYPAQYGDALSGVLDVTLKAPAEALSGDLGIDLLNAHVFVNRRPFLAAARAGYIGFLLGLMDSEERFEPHYGDVLVKFDEPLTEADRLSVYGLYAADTNRIDEPGVEDDVRSRYHNGTAWARWSREMEAGSLEVFAFGGGASRRRTEGATDRDDRDLGWGGAKADWTWDGGGLLRWKGGADVRWQRGRYDYKRADASIDIDADVSSVLARGYAVTTWRFSSLWTAETGLRLLALSANRSLRAAPSAALSFHPGNGLTLRAAWGIYHQPVDPLHLPVETGVSRLVKPERAMHWVGGLQYRHEPSRLNVRVEAWIKTREDLVGAVIDAGRKSQIVWPKEKGKAAGWELVLDKGVGDMRFHFGFGWSISRVRDEGAWYPAQNDRRYAADLGWSWTPGAGWSVYAGWRYHAGEPYTRIRYEGTVAVPIERNGGRLPPYHSLDLRVGKTFEIGATRLEIYLQILNLYDRRNVHEYVYSREVTGSGTVTVRDEESLFPMLPTMGVNWSF